MTTVDEIVVKIRADNKQFNNAVKESTNTLNKSTKSMDKDIKGIDTSVRGLSSSFKMFGGVLATLGIASLGKQMINAASDMQKLDARLKATTGSMVAANEAMKFLRKTAGEQSVDLLDLADGYNRLLPAVKSGVISMSDMRNVLRLVNDNIKAFGLNSGEAQGIFLGLSQTLASGTVTTEDLRQVTDRLPGSFAKIEEAMGLANGGLKDLIATGTLTADKIVPALTKALSENAGAAVSMANTYDSQMVRLKNSFRDAATNIANESGLLTGVTAAISGIADVLDILAGKNTEAKIAEEQHNIALERAKELHDELNGATKERTEEIKKQNEELLKNTKIQIANTEAQIADLVAKSEALAKLRSDSRPSDLDAENAQSSTLVLGSEDYARRQQLEYIDRINKLNDSLHRQKNELKDLTSVIATGFTPAQIKANEETEKLNKELEKQAQNTKAQKSLEKYNKSIEKLNDSLAETTDQLEFENKLLGLSDRSREVEIAKRGSILKIMKELNITHEKANDLYSEEIDKIGELAAQNYELEEAQSQASKSSDELARSINQASENIQNSLADSIADIIKNFDDLESVGKRIFSNIANHAINSFSQIAAQKIMNGGGAGGAGGLNIGSIGNMFGGGASGASGGGFLSSLGNTGMAAASANPVGLAVVGSMIAMELGSMTADALGGTKGAKIGGQLLGPVGALVGSLFGPGTPTEASEFATGGGNTSFDSKNADPKIAKGLSAQIDSMLNTALLAGLDLTQSTFRGGYNTNQFGGGFLQVGGRDITFNIEDAEDTQRAINELIQELIKTADVADNEVASALRELNFEGKDAAQVIREIGIATGELADQFDKSLENEILKLTDARQYEINQLKAHTESLRQEAIAIGANIDLIDQYEELKLASIDAAHGINQLTQDAKNMAADFMRISIDLKKTALDLQLGGNSALSPEDQLSIAKQQFESLSKRAALGDVEAGNALSSAANAYIQESRDYYGSSAGYKSAFADVQSGLLNASDTFARNANNQGAIVDSINNSTQANAKGQSSIVQQLSVLTNQVNTLTQANQELNIKMSG